MAMEGSLDPSEGDTKASLNSQSVPYLGIARIPCILHVGKSVPGGISYVVYCIPGDTRYVDYAVPGGTPHVAVPGGPGKLDDFAGVRDVRGRVGQGEAVLFQSAGVLEPRGSAHHTTAQHDIRETGEGEYQKLLFLRASMTAIKTARPLGMMGRSVSLSAMGLCQGSLFWAQLRAVREWPGFPGYATGNLSLRFTAECNLSSSLPQLQKLALRSIVLRCKMWSPLSSALALFSTGSPQHCLSSALARLSTGSQLLLTVNRSAAISQRVLTSAFPRHW